MGGKKKGLKFDAGMGATLFSVFTISYLMSPTTAAVAVSFISLYWGLTRAYDRNLKGK